MAVKLKDIAEKTGYSVNTVSLVMNGKNLVAEKTRKIIEECAKEMGYVANYSAKKLREGKSYTIALIIDDLRSYIFSTIADEIIVYAAENKYAVSVFITNGDDTKERNAITSAVGRGVDGIIIAPVQSSGENFAYLKKCGVAYVLLGRVYDEFGDDLSVVYDEIRIGYLTAENLLCNGHSEYVIFDTVKKTICPGTIHDIKDIAGFGSQEASKLFIVRRYSSALICVIYR